MQGTHDLAMNHCLAAMGSGFKATKSHTMALEPPCWTSSLTQRSPEQAAKTNPLQTGQGISDGRTCILESSQLVLCFLHLEA